MAGNKRYSKEDYDKYDNNYYAQNANKINSTDEYDEYGNMVYDESLDTDYVIGHMVYHQSADRFHEEQFRENKNNTWGGFGTSETTRKKNQTSHTRPRHVNYHDINISPEGLAGIIIGFLIGLAFAYFLDLESVGYLISGSCFAYISAALFDCVKQKISFYDALKHYVGFIIFCAFMIFLFYLKT